MNLRPSSLPSTKRPPGPFPPASPFPFFHTKRGVPLRPLWPLHLYLLWSSTPPQCLRLSRPASSPLCNGCPKSAIPKHCVGDCARIAHNKEIGLHRSCLRQCYHPVQIVQIVSIPVSVLIYVLCPVRIGSIQTTR